MFLRITTISALIIIALILTGCATRRTRETEIMQSWIGYHQSELIAEWGPPTRIMPDGKGGTVLDYSYYKDLGERGYVTPVGRWRFMSISRSGYGSARFFYVNSHGMIYNFKWQRL